MLDLVLQVLIVLFGVVGLWLAGANRSGVRVWAGVLGLCAQPVWATVFVRDGRWLMLSLCVLYGVCHARMVWNNRKEVG